MLSMVKHTKDSIHASLTELPSGSAHKALRKEATQIFKTIQVYMGDRKPSKEQAFNKTVAIDVRFEMQSRPHDNRLTIVLFLDILILGTHFFFHIDRQRMFRQLRIAKVSDSFKYDCLDYQCTACILCVETIFFTESYTTAIIGVSSYRNDVVINLTTAHVSLWK